MGFFTKKKQTLSFPFDDQQNTACIVCCHILEGHPILYVSHDEDDGMCHNNTISCMNTNRI